MGTLPLAANLMMAGYFLAVLLVFLIFLKLCKRYNLGGAYSAGARNASAIAFIAGMSLHFFARFMGMFVLLIPIAALGFAILVYLLAASSGISVSPITGKKHFTPIVTALALAICTWAAYKGFWTGRTYYYAFLATRSSDPAQIRKIYGMSFSGATKDQTDFILEVIAQNPYTPTSILIELADNPNMRVRKELAQNPRFPLEGQNRLIQSTDDYSILFYSAKDPRLGHEQLLALASKDFRYPSGEHGELGEWLYDQYVYPQLIDHPSESQDVLDLLATRVRSDNSVRHFIKNPKATCKEWETLHSRQSAMPNVRPETWLSLAEKMVRECGPVAKSSKT